MTNCCVCYINDSGYLLPALVSAIQARQFSDPAIADIVIVCIDENRPKMSVLQELARQYSIELIYLDKSHIDNFDIMFARFFVHRLLAEQYRRIVYIDSDTQIAGSLNPLFSVEIPPGDFLACRDPSALFAQLSGKWMKRVLSERNEIGFGRPYGDYFNSGVLVIERDMWPELSQRCLDLTRDLGQNLRYPDQDILNLAVGEHCKLISSRWNFPGFLIGGQAERLIEPRIYHFMSNPRPWNEAVPPWGEIWARPYKALLNKHPELSFLTPRKVRHRTARYWLQQRFKLATEYNAAGLVAEAAPDISF